MGSAGLYLSLRTFVVGKTKVVASKAGHALAAPLRQLWRSGMDSRNLRTSLRSCSGPRMRRGGRRPPPITVALQVLASEVRHALAAPLRQLWRERHGSPEPPHFASLVLRPEDDGGVGDGRHQSRAASQVLAFGSATCSCGTAAAALAEGQGSPEPPHFASLALRPEDDGGGGRRPPPITAASQVPSDEGLHARAHAPTSERHDLALGERDAAVHARGKLMVVGGDERRQAGLPHEGRERAEHIGGGVGVEVAGRLVGQ